jgi:transcriptional regulator with GAF, ATPase, and Fis domain
MASITDLDIFLHPNKLAGFLQRLPSRTPMQEAIMLQISRKGSKAREAAALQACRSVDLAGNPASDTLVFLFCWNRLASQTKHFEEAAACAELARSLKADDASADVFAFILAAQATDCCYKTHDYSQFPTYSRDALEVARTAEHRTYRRVVEKLAPIYALMGLRSLIQQDINALEAAQPGFSSNQRCLIVDLLEAVEACRVEEAYRALGRLAERADDPADLDHMCYTKQETLGAYLRTFPAQMTTLLHGPIDANWVSLEQQGLTEARSTIFDHLRERRPEEALRLAYTVRKSYGEGRLRELGIDGYFLVRCELANQNANAGRRALNIRMDAGLSHPLDHFFLARIALLERDPAEANRLFLECLPGIAALNARNRLLFELALSCELPASTLLAWMQLIDQPQGRKTSSAELAESVHRQSISADDRRAKSNPSQRLIRQVKPGIARVVGRSSDIENVRRFIKTMAGKDASILVTGETGTGKDVVARAIHEQSPRATRPFLAINCAALGENLLTSELFGHKRGAFTGAEGKKQGLVQAAGEGTLFLDEIGEISPRMQASLLRVLESGEFRPVGGTRILTMKCRIVAATNRDLVSEVKGGRFREDLYYRLRRFQIHLSPLDSRREDVLPLAYFFFNWDRTGGEQVRLHPRLEAFLVDHNWPGNVRELRNTIDNIRLFHGDKIEYDIDDLLDLKPDWRYGPSKEGPGTLVPTLPPQAPPASRPSGPNQASQRSLLRLERAVLELFQSYGCLTRKELARELDVSGQTAAKYLKRLVAAGHIERITPSRSSRSNYYQLIKRT